MAMVVLPVPGLPSKRNSRPAVKPPFRISSKPGTPVRAIFSALIVSPCADPNWPVPCQTKKTLVPDRSSMAKSPRFLRFSATKPFEQGGASGFDKVKSAFVIPGCAAVGIDDVLRQEHPRPVREARKAEVMHRDQVC